MSYDKCVASVGATLKERGFDNHKEVAANMCVMWADGHGVERTFGRTLDEDEKRRTFALSLGEDTNISYTQHKILIRMYAFITTYSEEYGRVPAQHIILKHLEISERQFLNLIDTVNEQIVELDTVTEIESSNGMDMDTLAEYEKVNKLIHKLPKKEFELVQQYLGDPTMKDEKIRHILVGLRASLNLVKEGVIDG
jgi:hypothetical protein